MKTDYRDKKWQQGRRILYAVGLTIIIATALGLELLYSYQFCTINAQQNVSNLAQVLAQNIGIQLSEEDRNQPKSLANSTPEKYALSVLNTEIKMLDIKPKNVIEIIDLQLRLLARNPQLSNSKNPVFMIRDLQNFIEGNQSQKNAILTSPIDGITRIYSIQRVKTILLLF